MAEPTVEKVLLALVPIAVMAAMQTTMIRASMTAYSTAVGPSSFFMNSTTDFVMARMVRSPVGEKNNRSRIQALCRNPRCGPGPTATPPSRAAAQDAVQGGVREHSVRVFAD